MITSVQEFRGKLKSLESRKLNEELSVPANLFAAWGLNKAQWCALDHNQQREYVGEVLEFRASPRLREMLRNEINQVLLADEKRERLRKMVPSAAGRDFLKEVVQFWHDVPWGLSDAGPLIKLIEPLAPSLFVNTVRPESKALEIIRAWRVASGHSSQQVGPVQGLMTADVVCWDSEDQKDVYGGLRLVQTERARNVLGILEVKGGERVDFEKGLGQAGLYAFHFRQSSQQSIKIGVIAGLLVTGLSSDEPQYFDWCIQTATLSFDAEGTPLTLVRRPPVGFGWHPVHGPTTRSWQQAKSCLDWLLHDDKSAATEMTGTSGAQTCPPIDTVPNRS